VTQGGLHSPPETGASRIRPSLGHRYSLVAYRQARDRARYVRGRGRRPRSSGPLREAVPSPARRCSGMLRSYLTYRNAIKMNVSADQTRQHYRAPTWFDRKVMNPLIAGATRLGLSAWGSRILEVKGRKSGQPRRNPVNPLDYEGSRYLVARGRRRREGADPARLPAPLEVGGRPVLRRRRPRLAARGPGTYRARPSGLSNLDMTHHRKISAAQEQPKAAERLVA
jgi:hypothetical protein